jgi:hypothetical protein
LNDRYLARNAERIILEHGCHDCIHDVSSAALALPGLSVLFYVIASLAGRTNSDGTAVAAQKANFTSGEVKLV